MRHSLSNFVALLATACLASTAVSAQTVTVAVAANFLATSKILAHQFEQESHDKVLLSAGSTGKLYAQIRHGAPYDVFLAADKRRPKLLESEGVALKGSRFTYAIGRLALWSPKSGLVDTAGAVLRGSSIQKLAIANPKTAPYGAAAQQVLQKMYVWQQYSGRIVRGEDVGQTWQFVSTGNADAGFIALAQITLANGNRRSGSLWLVPQQMYTPIEQQAVTLKRAQGNAAAHAFTAFLRSKQARAEISRQGYALP